MQAPATISNSNPPLQSMDFSTLLSNGIADCQNLGGDLWTDYNEHDPGVTTLEQLCYAITDLAYRLTFDVADVIAECPVSSEDKNNALYTGDRVLTCNPFTLTDYRKLLFDGLSDAIGDNNFKNVWLSTSANPSPSNQGLLEIWIEVFDIAQSGKNAALIDRAEILYQQHRNLAEDATSAILTPMNVTVQGQIQIAATADPNEVLANLLYDLQESFSHTPQVESVDELMQQGVPLDQIFEGPLLSSGVILDAQMIALPRQISLASISNTILNSSNVIGIDQLALTNDQQKNVTEISIPAGQVARLSPSIYQIQKTFPFTLIRNGMVCAYNADLVQRRIAKRLADRLKSSGYAMRTQEEEVYTSLPGGNNRQIEEYYSVQRQFPETYGIGANGVLQSACNTSQQAADLITREAQAKQFKAYLLFFEQILTNGHAQYANASRLLSLESDLKQTYFWQSLGGAEIAAYGPPNIDDLFVAPPHDDQPGASEFLVFLQSREVDTEVLICSRLMVSRIEAVSLRETIVRLGGDIRNYRLQKLPNQEVRHVLYHESEKVILAYSMQRFTDTASAQANAQSIAEIIRTTSETSMQSLLVIEERGKCSVQLVNAQGQILLVATGLTAAQQKQTIQALIDNGTHPNNYAVMIDKDGLFLLMLRNRRKEEIMRGEERFPDAASAARSIAALVDLVQSLCCDTDAQARYIICLPKPQPSQAALEYYKKRLAALVAKYDPSETRRNAFLNHLLARFSERFYDKELTSFQPPSLVFTEEFEQDLIEHKIYFLRQYARPKTGDGSQPCMGGGRSQAAYNSPSISYSISGLAMRLQSLLCVQPTLVNAATRKLSAQPPQPSPQEELYVIESIKLRSPDANVQLMRAAQISVIFSADAIRFQNLEFRKFAERVVYENCPAHLVANCQWLNGADMNLFKNHHGAWSSLIRSGKTVEAEAPAKVLRAILAKGTT